MQQPLAQMVSLGHCDGSMPPAPHTRLPDGQVGVPHSPEGQPPDPPVPVEPHSPDGQLPPAQNSTQASPESPPTLFWSPS